MPPISPRQAGFYMPAEWMPHQACWLAFPSHEDLWEGALTATQQEVISLVRAIAVTEAVELLVLNDAIADLATHAFATLPVRLHHIPFGDIWMRDIGPIFVHHRTEHRIASLTFAWNGWGHKYLLDHDALVSERVTNFLQEDQGIETFRHPWVLEGGAIEVDGMGTCLTTRQCLLNPNRNPAMGEGAIATGLMETLGVEKILWLDQGLKNDHTDGHIDTIARFVAPHTVACMTPTRSDDPNYRVLNDIQQQLATYTDASGTPLKVVPIPSPGMIRDAAEEIMPASYLNFYIANGRVIMPLYGSEMDEEALRAIAACFPDRQVIGLMAKHILRGGGAFHCITCHQPMMG
ncbi:MAG: agmatine deiminase family protein [Oscillatoriales cyanobacterium SM2_2_1]|nr:agmatine deiminase family protein [Oscillatoriales cyanobacterium SM2_2_1]